MSDGKIGLERVKTCWNCKHCTWEVWLPTIKVHCDMKMPKVAPDTYCIMHELKDKSNWKDKWPYTVQHPGTPYEDI